MTSSEADRAGTAGFNSKLAGRVALVTGGTRGIGAAISRSLANQGATVAAGYGRDKEHAEQFLAEIKAEGVKGSIHQGNIGVGDDCRRVVAEVIAEHGSLDILINNAGITIDKTVLNLNDSDWDKVLAVNLSGAFFLSQAALAHMIERGTGRIVHVSSIIGQANYAASKSGLFGLTKTLAKEAAFMLQRADKLHDNPIGITVNTVTPGFVETEMIDTVPEKVIKRITDQIPVRRFARPEEIARVVHFLASDAAGYITGQGWGVNGGMDM